MTIDLIGSGAAYVGILAAAALEGEWTFIAAATLAGQGILDPVAVIAAGTVGATLGDQVLFNLLRLSLAGGRVHRWLSRMPAVARHSDRLVRQVRRHESAMIFAIRFAPGLRIALTAACAYARVPPLKMSLINIVASLAWASSVLAVVAYVVPSVFARLGISERWVALVPAVLILIVVSVVRVKSRTAEDAASG